MTQGHTQAEARRLVEAMLAMAAAQAKVATWTPSAVSALSPEHSDLAFYPMTDLGNAERFAARHKGKFLHAPELGWLAYDGQRWSLKGADAKVMRAAHATARSIQDEAGAIRGTDDDVIVSEPKGKDPVKLSDRLATHGRSSEGAQRLTAMIKHAAPYLSVSVDELDADPWMVNVENGTLVIDPRARDSDPVSFRPHDPDDLITKLAPVSFDPVETCPRYDRFMDEVQPSKEMQRHLHQWGGYGLMHLVRRVGGRDLAFLIPRIA